jgi:hypothetical protein
MQDLHGFFLCHVHRHRGRCSIYYRDNQFSGFTYPTISNELYQPPGPHFWQLATPYHSRLPANHSLCADHHLAVYLQQLATPSATDKELIQHSTIMRRSNVAQMKRRIKIAARVPFS